MGDESEPKNESLGTKLPFQKLGDKIDPRPRVGGRKWLFFHLLNSSQYSPQHRGVLADSSRFVEKQPPHQHLRPTTLPHRRHLTQAPRHHHVSTQGPPHCHTGATSPRRHIIVTRAPRAHHTASQAPPYLDATSLPRKHLGPTSLPRKCHLTQGMSSS
jgi:hypothetical protein